MQTKHSVESDEIAGEVMTGAELKAFAAVVPDDARITPRMSDRGTQRDPMPVMVALRAAWEEQT